MSLNEGAGQKDMTVRVVESIARRMGHLICGLGGHDLIRSYESGRICLRCTSCSYETPGWTLERAGRRRGAPAQAEATSNHGHIGAVLWDGDRIPAIHSPMEG
jgi:hypothetical protein